MDLQGSGGGVVELTLVVTRFEGRIFETFKTYNKILEHILPLVITQSKIKMQ